ncbi:MAG: TadE/TadG family type IV pilus assembly protein [Bryobacteraceae bacterium]
MKASQANGQTGLPRRGRAGERGNAMVETALIFIPMLAMFFGVVDVSMVVFLQNTLMNATREGTRFAITFSPTYNGTSCATSQATCITSAVQTNAFGFLAGTKSNLITVNYYTANNLTTPIESCNAGTCTQNGTLPQTLSNGTVVNYVNQPGNIVEVVVANYPWNWIFPVSATGFALTSNSINLGASSMNVLGGLAVGTTVPPSP